MIDLRNSVKILTENTGNGSTKSITNNNGNSKSNINKRNAIVETVIKNDDDVSHLEVNSSFNI